MSHVSTVMVLLLLLWLFPGEIWHVHAVMRQYSRSSMESLMQFISTWLPQQLVREPLHYDFLDLAYTVVYQFKLNITFPPIVCQFHNKHVPIFTRYICMHSRSFKYIACTKHIHLKQKFIELCSLVDSIRHRNKKIYTFLNIPRIGKFSRLVYF